MAKKVNYNITALTRKSITELIGLLNDCLDDSCDPEIIDRIITVIDNKYLSSANAITEKPKEDITNEEVISFALNEQPTIIVAFSGGKDSIAMVLHLLEIGIPKDKIELWHHDVDGHGEDLFDWKCTVSYCQAFADHFDLPILFSYRKGGIVREIFRENETSQSVFFQKEAGSEFTELASIQEDKYKKTRRKFPAVASDLKTRWCSGNVKIDVMSKAINNTERFDSGKIIVCTGERRAESKARSKYPFAEKYRSNSTARKSIQWRPIVDWSDDEVWGIMEKYRIQPHPSYMLGWSRCSCQTCIFNSSNTWATIKQISPAKIERISEIENEIGYTLYSGEDINQKTAKGESYLSSDDDYWVSQALNEFTHPIVIDNWRLPKGANNIENCGAS